MNSFINRLMPIALGLSLAACGSSDRNRPTVSIDELAEGAYTISTGSQDAPTVGRYLSGADGSRLLLVGDDNGVTKVLYRKSGNAGWVGVPPISLDTRVELLRKDPQVVTAPTLAALAGRYVTTPPAGGVAVFSITAEGDIVAGSASACRLSGKLVAGVLPGTLKLSLSASNCGDIPASSNGVLSVDGDLAPAAFRLVADDGNKVVDLRAFTE